MARTEICEQCSTVFDPEDAFWSFSNLIEGYPLIPYDLEYTDRPSYSCLCGDCAFKAAYEEYYGEPYKSDEEKAEESDDYDPDCPYNDWYDNDESSDDEEEDNESLSAEDAALIYMSSGEDEDYDFSDGRIDTSRYKDE